MLRMLGWRRWQWWSQWGRGGWWQGGCCHTFSRLKTWKPISLNWPADGHPMNEPKGTWQNQTRKVFWKEEVKKQSLCKFGSTTGPGDLRNTIATAGVLGGVTGLLFGGFWLGAASFVATSYLAKKEVTTFQWCLGSLAVVLVCVGVCLWCVCAVRGVFRVAWLWVVLGCAWTGSKKSQCFETFYFWSISLAWHNGIVAKFE